MAIQRVTALTRRTLIRTVAQLGAAAAGSTLLDGCGLPPITPTAVTRRPRIGYLYAASETAGKSVFDAFRDGLREYGWIPGDNLMLEARYTDGTSEQLAARVSELVGERLDLLVAGGSTAAEALTAATHTVPIIMLYVADPVGIGLVSSLARPGGNTTGIAGGVGLDLLAKRLQLLREWVPGLRRVGYLTSLQTQSARLYAAIVHDAARATGVEVRMQEVARVDDIEPGLAALASWAADALLIENFSPLGTARERSIRWVAQRRVVAHYTARSYVEVGGLAYYGADGLAVYRRGGYYVDRVLRGASPANLPIEQPTAFEFVANRGTAEALSLTLPADALAQVTEWLR